ncbi:unnamed protein product [Clavelina lepadiformis]|uniref:Uncharacterized protein n=1 Tax=Clavelina lepadiformis TaxID=159417 RepID=A0ABP0GHB4_CLALP
MRLGLIFGEARYVRQPPANNQRRFEILNSRPSPKYKLWANQQNTSRKTCKTSYAHYAKWEKTTILGGTNASLTCPRRD